MPLCISCHLYVNTSTVALKVVFMTFLLAFLFHFESSFRSEDNEILTFEISKISWGHQMQYLSMKHWTHFTGNEIWLVYIILQKKCLYQKCDLGTSLIFLILKQSCIKKKTNKEVCMLICSNFDTITITYQ